MSFYRLSAFLFMSDARAVKAGHVYMGYSPSSATSDPVSASKRISDGENRQANDNSSPPSTNQKKRRVVIFVFLGILQVVQG